MNIRPALPDDLDLLWQFLAMAAYEPDAASAKAIPFRKKRGGQGLLFHRSELDRWVQAAYEPTGCAGEVELWSSTNQ